MPRLTKTLIDNLKHHGRQSNHIVWDTEIPGFGVRVYPSGKRAFVFRHQTRQGRRSMIVIGPYGPFTLEHAREQARSLYTRAKAGEDLTAKPERDPTVRELWELYWGKHGQKKRSALMDEYLAKCFILPAWGSKVAAEIDYGDAIALHESVVDGTFRRNPDYPKAKGGPIAANRVISLVSKIWSLAMKRQVIPPNSVNPAKGVDRAEEVKRERWLTHEELERVGQTLRSEPNPAIRAIFKAYIMTGCRKSELRYATLDELIAVNTRRGKMTLLYIPPERSKSKKPRRIPLPADLVDEILQIPRRAGERLLFPGWCKDGSLNVDKIWQRIREAAGIPDVRIHDLRHTAISLMVQEGVSLAIAGAVAGHSDPRVTDGYAHLNVEALDEALGTLRGVVSKHLLKAGEDH